MPKKLHRHRTINDCLTVNHLRMNTYDAFDGDMIKSMLLSMLRASDKATPEMALDSFGQGLNLICQHGFDDDYLALEHNLTKQVIIRIPMQVIFDCLTDYESYCTKIL
jgi:hypothetical protein